MSTTTATTTEPPPFSPVNSTSPSNSTLPQLSSRDAHSLRGVIGLGLVITMPILMFLPPRRFNAIMALQVGMLGFGTNELLEYRTGQGIVWWASKPIRIAQGIDDSEVENQKIKERLRRRRERKGEEVKKRIEEEAMEVQNSSKSALKKARGSGRNASATMTSSSHGRWRGWSGREG